MIKESDELAATWPEETYPEQYVPFSPSLLLIPRREEEISAKSSPHAKPQMVRRKSLGIPAKKLKVDFRGGKKKDEYDNKGKNAQQKQVFFPTL